MKAVFTKLLLFTAIALSFQTPAFACSVCGVAKEEARVAYYATTAILSFLPLIMIGGIVLYLFKKKR